MRNLISAADADLAEKARRERLLRHLESAARTDPLELAKYSLERAGATFLRFRQVRQSDDELPHSKLSRPFHELHFMSRMHPHLKSVIDYLTQGSVELMIAGK